MQRNFVVVFVSFLLELESIETRKIKTVKIRGSFPKCHEISSSFAFDGHPKNGHPKKLEGGTPPDPFEKRGGGTPSGPKKIRIWGGGQL